MPGNPGATLYVGNLDDRVDERVLYEIMVQAGPLVEVYIPRDKDSKRSKGYGFTEFKTEESADYALRLFSGLLSLYNRPLRLSISGGDKPSQPIQCQEGCNSSVGFPRSQEKDGYSDQNCSSQPYNHQSMVPSVAASYSGMQMPGFLSTVAQANAQLAALGHWGLQGRQQHAYAPASY